MEAKKNKEKAEHVGNGRAIHLKARYSEGFENQRNEIEGMGKFENCGKKKDRGAANLRNRTPPEPRIGTER